MPPPPLVEIELNSITENEIDYIIQKYTSHPSILKIKEHVKPEYKVEFQDVTTDKIRKDIRDLNSKKPQIDSEITSESGVSQKCIIIQKIYVNLTIH